MPTPPVFLDSNVFFYAAGRKHPLRSVCQDLLRDVATGKLEATTSTEVIQELLHVLRRRGRTSEALDLSRKAMALVPEVLPVTGEDMALACDLQERHPTLPTRDAIHAATMQNHGLARIASADRHFDSIEGIERLAVFAGDEER